MTMTDPIADMLSRVRNANNAYHDTVTMPSLRSLATASSRRSDMVAGSLALPTHRRPSLGSRTARTEPP